MGNGFVEALKEDSKLTYTENGALAYNTSSDALVDLFATIGALRNNGSKNTCISNVNESRLHVMIDEAYQEDKLLLAKILFYARDIRGGLGERAIFREAIKYCADKYPDIIKNNISLIGFYGRWDDLYSLVGTSLEDDMWKVMKIQLESDIHNMDTSGNISLLAKWIKSADASSERTRRLGCLTARKLGYSVYEFKRIIKSLRRYLDILESHMSANDWNTYVYSKVPSRAMMVYRKAFERHDAERFNKYLLSVQNGEDIIKANGIYPYDIVEKLLYKYDKSTVLEEQWKALPNYVDGDCDVLVMADTSGSMSGRPMASALGLALYFAERNRGPFHNIFMTFSSVPEIVTIKGKSLYDKINRMRSASWSMSTNLEAAFDKVLNIAVSNNVPVDELPKSIIVISDMEIDGHVESDWTFYEAMVQKYSDVGYVIPNIVFWNVNSRNDVFHADSRRKGVQLVSGQSVSIFKTLMGSIGKTPYESMLDTLNNDRYSYIIV